MGTLYGDTIFKRPDESIVMVYTLNGIPYLGDDPRLIAGIGMPITEIERIDDEPIPSLIDADTDAVEETIVDVSVIADHEEILDDTLMEVMQPCE